MQKLIVILILILAQLSLKAQQHRHTRVVKSVKHHSLKDTAVLAGAHRPVKDSSAPTDHLHILKDSSALADSIHLGTDAALTKDTMQLDQRDSSLTDSMESELLSGDFKLKKPFKPLIGIASFYSKNLDGSKTATGEIYRNSKLTGASNHVKMHSWVRVTNLKNHRSVIIRINDRMHPRMARKGRVVDLSRAAAIKLDFLKSGLARVKSSCWKKIVD